MKPHLSAICILTVLALAACDKAMPRQTPPDPMAAAPPPAGAPTVAGPGAGLSAGLPKRPEFPGFYLDHAGAASDPLNHQPAVTPAGQPVLLDGFGYDPVTKTPAKGVDVVVDGKAYGTTYGSPRQDVATFTKVPGLVPVGYKTVLPAGTLAPGPHTAVVRVIGSDGKAYFEGPPIKFEVR